MTAPITRPALRYFGAKWKLADWIIQHLPQHKVYVEPFGGSAAVLLRKQPSALEVYNDLNGDLVNFFRVLRSDADKLIALIELTPYSREEFNYCADWAVQNPAERARRFYVQSAQGRAFSGIAGSSTWRKYTNVSERGHHLLAKNWTSKDNLYAVANRIKHVQIEQQSALKIISQYDSENALFYVDPPYDLSTRKDWKYAVDTDQSQQIELAQTLNQCKGMVVLSGYDCDSYQQWYGHWKRIDKKTYTQASNAGTARTFATESLWLNHATQSTFTNIF